MSKIRRYLFPAILGLLNYISIRLVTDIVSTEQFWHRSWQTNMVEIVFCVLTGYLIDGLFRKLVSRLNKQSLVFKASNITREFLYVSVVTMAIINPIVQIIHLVNRDPVTLSDITIANLITALNGLLYYAILRGNNYIVSFIQQQTQLERLKNENLQTELRFLKAQYHPHFIFNALNTIYFQMDENVPEAKKTVEKFSDLLRYQLLDHQQPVLIKQELDHLDNFIHLQRQRSSGRLDVQIHYDEEVKSKQLFPLLLLPLVENAFKYAGGNNKIIIEARMDGTAICFMVQNSLPERPSNKGNGIGLDHLQRRLHLLYPEKHSFLIEQSKDHYKAALKLESL